jgi:ABC-type multidrug transport system ATPase subunit/peptidoglycan/LPS O-acetylase OafA/YrhL
MSANDRLHALDAVRAFALLLGVVFHAGFSFLPGMITGIWAIADNSPSTAIGVLLFASHIFRMSLFFFVAGFFARMMFHRKGARGFWTNRGKRILVPLVVGWIVLFPSIAAVWMWGIVKFYGDAIPQPPAGLPSPPLAFPLTHLWFLYYLLVLYAIVIAVRSAVVALDRLGAVRRAADAAAAGAVRTGLAAVLLPLPLVAALWARPDWIMWFGIPTPDQSLLPQVASLVGYGTAVGFGWLVHRQPDLLGVWGRFWPAHLLAGLVATAICLAIAGLKPALVPAAADFSKLAYAASYGIAIWSWSFAVIGIATRIASQPSRTTRYVADASYWIYLVHLPIVAAFQVLVGQWPWHWSIKFPLVLAASLSVLFVTYHYLVRSTFIGQVLNGRRYPRHASGPEPTTPGPGDRGRNADGGDARVPVAALNAVEKKYGATVALAGLTLDVRRGELLAVLGPNGAGKSTAIALWLGLLEPDAGSVLLVGGSPLDVESRRQVGVMMQDVGLTPEMRVRDLVALTTSYYPEPLPVEETLAMTRLESLALRPYGKLSGGQKRQVQFALAICGRPRMLFLDEPTVGLDIEAREAMWTVLRRLVADGCSIVLTTHYLEEAEALADRVAVLAAGRLIACDTVAEVRAIVSRKQIECASRLPVDDVQAWPGVVGVSRDGDRLHITVVEAEDVVRRLLAADATVRHLEIRQAGLAEAFSELTKEAA